MQRPTENPDPVAASVVASASAPVATQACDSAPTRAREPDAGGEPLAALPSEPAASSASSTEPQALLEMPVVATPTSNAPSETADSSSAAHAEPGARAAHDVSSSAAAASRDANATDASSASTDTSVASVSSSSSSPGAPHDSNAPAPAHDARGPGRWSFASRALRAAKKLLIEDDIFGGQAEATLLVDAEPSHASGTAPADGSVDASNDASAAADPAACGEAAPVAAAAPALCGHSSVLAVPEVLGLLANLHKSGMFTVWNEHDAFRIRLLRGTVVSAQATSSEHRLLLGRILVDHGALTEEALHAFVERMPAPKRRLGDALVEAGLIERATLESAIQFQAQRVFHSAYDLRDAWYRFDVERDEPAHERGLSVTHLLLESARMRDETEQRLSDVLGDPFDEPQR
ncbi:MAG: DUF4388 domain-containing protein [Planctomycetes bacterium]|nr:DUF4388 domain-containing protein [Planctomycetota bacterium]